MTAISRRPTVPSPAAPTSTTQKKVPVDPGVLHTVDQPGLWLVDLSDRRVHRISDEAAFDTVGELLLTARGADIVAMPLAGGEPVIRYTIPSGPGGGFPRTDRSGTVVSINAAPDGSAVIGTADSTTGADGVTTATASLYQLYSPAGQQIRLPDRLYLTGSGGQSSVWSPDGSRLAIDFLGKPYLLRPDGTVIVGPVPHPPPTPTYGNPPLFYRWTHDNSLVATLDGLTYSRFEAATATWSPIPGFELDVDFAADGRMVGHPASPPGVFDAAKLIVTDPAGATPTVISQAGRNARWSPDGQWISYLTTNPNSADDALRLIRPGGTPHLTLKPAPRVRVDYQPQWSSSGRYLVVRVSPRT